MAVLSSKNHNGSIVLIGPTGVGKTTVGMLLAEKLQWGFIELDDLRSTWYPEFGLDPEVERRAMVQGGLLELVAAWKPFELLSVERVMKENPVETVIAFGGGQSVYVNDEMLARAQQALDAASRVILLLPTDHGPESMAVLQDRLRSVDFVTEQENPDEFLRAFAPILKMQLQSESNTKLATELIVTGHSTPEELVSHILTTMESQSAE